MAIRHLAAAVLLLIAIANPAAIAAGLRHDCCPQGTCFCNLISSDGAGCSRQARAGCSVDAADSDSVPLPGNSSETQHQRLLPRSPIVTPDLSWLGARLLEPSLPAPLVLLPPTPPPRTSRPV